MSTSIYKINKGINKPLEFRGLKAQYIGYLACGLLLLLLFFALLYICGVNSFICLGLIMTLGAGLFLTIYRLSRRFGRDGLMKKVAKKQIPQILRIHSRRIFLKLPIEN